MSWEALFQKSLLLTLGIMMVAAIVFYGVEKIRPVQAGQPVLRQGYADDLAYAFLNYVIVLPLAQVAMFSLTGAYLKLIVPYQAFGSTIQSWPLPVQVLLALLLLDFITYWRHRFTHVVRWAWPFHAVHHSAEEIDWLTKYRMHPLDVFIVVAFSVVFMHVVGFGGLGFKVAVYIFYALDFLNHANLRFGFRSWLRYVIATPQFHRWHHAVEPEARNKNYSVLFAFYDWMFGSFYCPAGLYPAGYGLTGDMQKPFARGLWSQVLYPLHQLMRKLVKCLKSLCRVRS